MIYIGSFLHTTNQEQQDEKDRRHGEFVLVVKSENAETAIEKFRERILSYKETSSFFEGECSVFFSYLFEFEDFPQNKAVMLNYKSFAGDPMMPFIYCSAPSDIGDACRIYDWEKNKPEAEGLSRKPFLHFGP